MKILGYTTRNIRGVGSNLIEHFYHLNGISESFDLITSDRTDGARSVFMDNCGIKIDRVISDYTELYYSKYNKFTSWMDIYNDLNVTQFKGYDLLYIAGGIHFPNSAIAMNGKAKGVYPKKTGITYVSTAVKVINHLVMLKAHREYNIPLHELAYDPDELSLYAICDELKLVPENNYYLYHGYDSPTYFINRLDTIPYYYNHKQNDPKDKIYDLTFGYTFKKDERSNYIQKFNDLANTVSNKNVFVKELGGDKTTETFVQKSDYISYIKQSRFTYIMPSFWDRFFSVYRLQESVINDCLPIIGPDCNTSEICKSFDMELDDLKLDHLPSEEFRIEKLKYLKDKMFNCNLKMLKGVNYKGIQSSGLENFFI